MRFCAFPVRDSLLAFVLLTAASGLGACGSDTGSGTSTDDSGSDAGGSGDGSTNSDGGSDDVGGDDTGATDAGNDVGGADAEPDGDGLIPSGFEPGPTPDPGPLPRGYSETPPAGADAEACVTGQWWAQRDRESELMHPGGDCTSCHISRREGPRFTIAGTIMADYNEAEDCRGIDGPVVEIYGADGTLLETLQTNSAGNFFSERAIPADQLPYRARVIYDGRVREMATPQSSGQCNSCHTATGANAAPGRIVLP